MREAQEQIAKMEDIPRTRLEALCHFEPGKAVCVAQRVRTTTAVLDLVGNDPVEIGQ